MLLSDAGGWFWCAVGTRSLPSNAKDEFVVNTGANVRDAGVLRTKYDIILSG